MSERTDRESEWKDPEDSTPEGNGSFYIDCITRPATYFMSFEHTHSLIEILYLRKGSCVFLINDSSVRLGSGDLMLIAPGDRHATRYDGNDPSERINLMIDQNCLPEQLFRRAPVMTSLCSSSRRFTLDRETAGTAENIFARMLREQAYPKEFHLSFFILYSCELLLLLARQGQSSDELFIPNAGQDPDIQYAVHYIDRNYASPIRLGDIASRLNLNPSYFSTKFHQTTGKTFRDYLNEVRVRNAASLLTFTGDSITSIALACGFSSGNYFKDLFRSRYGMSPSAWRKSSSPSIKLDYTSIL